MISIPLPLAIILAGALFWPVTLAVAAMITLTGLLVSRRWIRVTCFILAGLLAADCLLAILLPPD